MSDNNNNKAVEFNVPRTPSTSIIKVIGVGGGGGNAVNHMYKEGIHDVSFALCNTDKQVLDDSPIPTRLQMGPGLGAGGEPEKASEYAEASLGAIHELLDDGTQMVFITAGMGGGTGTGAAPIIAREARKMGILTVGIVTIPFAFEGQWKIDLALDGVENISKEVDALLVVNNERLREIYSDLTIMNAFAKADDTLAVAARSISELITTNGIINVDFQDVLTTLKDGGVAIISTGYGEGENRVTKAIENALHSPLLNNNDIYDAKRLLLCITCSNNDEKGTLQMGEMTEVHEFMGKIKKGYRSKFGLAADPSLGNKVKVTILASGFGIENLPGMESKIEQRNEEEERVKAEDERRKAERRSRFYDSENAKKRPRHSHNVYRFTPESIDNDDIIAMVETNPTYKRTADVVKNIDLKARGEEEPRDPDDNTPNDMKAIIFG